jgi:hypothetical protein
MPEIVPHAPRYVRHKNNDLRADEYIAVGSSYGVFMGVWEDSCPMASLRSWLRA